MNEVFKATVMLDQGLDKYFVFGYMRLLSIAVAAETGICLSRLTVVACR